VIGCQKRFAQDCLAVSPRDASEEVGLGIRYKGLHLLHVSAELPDAFVPGRGVGREFSFRPVSGGPVWGNVFGVEAEFQDVSLRDAEVFEEHPGGVRQVCGFFPTEIGGKVFYYLFEFGVGASAGEEFRKVLAQGFIVVRGFRFRHGIIGLLWRAWRFSLAGALPTSLQVKVCARWSP
jgi:hypothetical protein